MSEKRYNDYGSWLRGRFPFRVQKLPVDAGFTCPNRDATKGTGGCVFCDNHAFTPSFCDRRDSITRQIAKGKQFFGRKYPDMRYLAYFQSFSNTYADLDTLRRRYEEALADEQVVGIVIGTRPDCVDTDVLNYLEHLSRQTFVVVEYGIESVNDRTLAAIKRGHDFACSRAAVEATAARGISTGAHVILGLPGEDREDMLRQAAVVSALPLDILKVHHLQIVRGTRLALIHEQAPLPVFAIDDYIALLAEYIALLRPDIILERFVSQLPPGMVVAPRWGVKSQEFARMLDRYMEQHDLWQGKGYATPWRKYSRSEMLK